MSESAPELQPDVGEILQVEEPYGKEPVVNVCVKGPVRIQSLPRKAVSTVTKLLAANGPGLDLTVVQMARANPRRAKVTIVANIDIRVAFSKAAAEELGRMAIWPVGRPLEIESVSDVYVAADGAAGTASVILEYWATGEDGGE